MARSRSNERLTFDQGTLRLIIGALAFAFPAMVCALTGKLTTSISASYHEVEARNMFVGFLFIMGSLLVSYKGHRRIVANGDGIKLWVLLKRYEEDWVSAVGGIAAIVTALVPTACDGCSFDTHARIHTIGAFILFANVVYFCLIAFLRRLNEKLLNYDELKGSTILTKKIDQIVRRGTQPDINPLRIFWRFLTSEICIFYQIFSEVSRQYDTSHQSQGRKVSASQITTKFSDLWTAYGKKLPRGWTYVICGASIAIVLAAFLLLGMMRPDLLVQSKITFTIETLALAFFGIAWMTASQMRYYRKVSLYFKLGRRTKSLVQQPAV